MDEQQLSLLHEISHYFNIPVALIGGYLFYKIHKMAKQTTRPHVKKIGEFIGWGGMFFFFLIFVYRAVQGFWQWFE